MNPQSGRPLTQEALEKEFTIKLTRGDILLINNFFHSQQNYTLADAHRISEMLAHFKDALVLTERDFVKSPENPQANGLAQGGLKV